MKKTISLNELYTWAKAKLKLAQIEVPDKTAGYLLAEILKLPKSKLVTQPDFTISEQHSKKIKTAVSSRCRHVPLQYILGTEDFWSMSLRVGKGVLIPRPETELILEETRRCVQSQSSPGPIADLGTGSGNLALALSKEYPRKTIYAVDTSAAALRWARMNRTRVRRKNVRFYQGNAEQPLPQKVRGTFSLVVSNPPYIPSTDLKILQPEVQHEPRQALDGGKDGLKLVRKMIRAAQILLRPNGLFICELGIGQAEQVICLMGAGGFGIQNVVHDWQKIERVITAKKR
ncbi:peptide chain release factor N(5)-glutamine methyltransferase [bacterium]|nr:peptide chain release factor N(5)-glutamine methyltransferase [bacterium]